MSLKRNARQNVELSCSALQDIQNYLGDAVQTVENNDTKKQIQQQIDSISSCLNNCQNIAGMLSE